MSTTFYLVYLKKPTGEVITVVDDFFSLDYVRKVNDVGQLTISLPGDKYLPSIAVDNYFEVWRGLQDAKSLYLDGGTAWFIRRWEEEDVPGSAITVTAFDANHLLKRRFIPYYSTSPYAQKTAPADDMIKIIGRENMTGLAVLPSNFAVADVARSMDTYFQVIANLSQGPSLSKSFAYRNVLKTFQEIAQASATQGTYLAFDVVAPAVTNLALPRFQLCTYIGQLGTDRTESGSGTPVILSTNLGNLAGAKLITDYSDESNFVYVGGQGEKENRAVQTTSDDRRIGLSPFNRVEDFSDARNTDNNAGLIDEARATLREGRPQYLFTGKLVQTEDTRYGRDLFFGDEVTAYFKNKRFDCRIDAVSVSVAPNKPDDVSVNFQSVNDVI